MLRRRTSEQLLVQLAAPSVEWAHRVGAELLTPIDQHVEPLHVQALKQVDLQVRDQGLGLQGDGARLGVEGQLNLRGH